MKRCAGSCDLRVRGAKAPVAPRAPSGITDTSGHGRFTTVSVAVQIGGRSTASPLTLG